MTGRGWLVAMATQVPMSIFYAHNVIKYRRTANINGNLLSHNHGAGTPTIFNVHHKSKHLLALRIGGN